MNVVVDAVVAVLQVLAFGDAVGCDQDIDVLLASRHKDVSVLRSRREACEDVVERRLKVLQRGSAVDRAADHAAVEAVLVHDVPADIIVQILCRVGECCEYQHLLVAGVDRVLDLL